MKRTLIATLLFCSVAHLSHADTHASESHFENTVKALAWCIERVGEDVPSTFTEEGFCGDGFESMWHKEPEITRNLTFALDSFEARSLRQQSVGHYEGRLSVNIGSWVVSGQLSYWFSGDDISGTFEILE